jgi:hypothetical protein
MRPDQTRENVLDEAMMMPRRVRCRTCGTTFLQSEAERDLLLRYGRRDPPTRCRHCRADDAPPSPRAA